jgi:hypothetical protein
MNKFLSHPFKHLVAANNLYRLHSMYFSEVQLKWWISLNWTTSEVYVVRSERNLPCIYPLHWKDKWIQIINEESAIRHGFWCSRTHGGCPSTPRISRAYCVCDCLGRPVLLLLASEEYHDGHHENLECPAACVVHRIAQAQPARKPDVTPRKFVD